VPRRALELAADRNAWRDLDAHLTKDGGWIVDFNDACNPWCAYGEDCVYPFVPPENWLKAPARAGEKKYPLREK